MNKFKVVALFAMSSAAMFASEAPATPAEVVAPVAEVAAPVAEVAAPVATVVAPVAEVAAPAAATVVTPAATPVAAVTPAAAPAADAKAASWFTMPACVSTFGTNAHAWMSANPVYSAVIAAVVGVAVYKTVEYAMSSNEDEAGF